MDAINLLKNYNPKCSRELVYKEQMLEILKNCPNCFSRSSEVGHFTASAWVVDSENEKFLMLHHAKLNSWFQLGGHCDGDENLLNVAIKEAQEESGLNNITPVSNDIFDIDIHLIPKVKNESPHYHFDVRFLLQHQGDEPLVSNRESKDLKWFKAGELPTSEYSIMRMHKKWLEMNVNKYF